MEHELKIWPQYFQRVFDGTKTFEVRNNDRGFQPGDMVTLSEWNPEINEDDRDPMGNLMNSAKGFTGRKLRFKIGYVLPISPDRVVFSLLSPSDCKHQWVADAHYPNDAFCTKCPVRAVKVSS